MGQALMKAEEHERIMQYGVLNGDDPNLRPSHLMLDAMYAKFVKDIMPEQLFERSSFSAVYVGTAIKEGEVFFMKIHTNASSSLFIPMEAYYPQMMSEPEKSPYFYLRPIKGYPYDNINTMLHEGAYTHKFDIERQQTPFRVSDMKAVSKSTRLDMSAIPLNESQNRDVQSVIERQALYNRAIAVVSDLYDNIWKLSNVDMDKLETLIYTIENLCNEED